MKVLCIGGGALIAGFIVGAAVDESVGGMVRACGVLTSGVALFLGTTSLGGHRAKAAAAAAAACKSQEPTS